MEKIRASIVTYKTNLLVLKGAIESFVHSPIAGLLTIVDNSPTDELRQYCAGEKIQYFHNGKNLGYGRAHNLPMHESLSSSEYHLVLNPDVTFDPAILEQLYDFMELNPAAGLVMPKVVGPDSKLQMLCKLLPTPLDLASRRFFPFQNWVRKFNDRYEMKETGYNKIINVPFLSGCFMFFRTSALSEVGLFDERFFLYAEDTDLSRRMHRQFQTLYYPYTEITHVHARGSYKDFNLTFQNIKSAVQYFNKWGWILDDERRIINERAQGFKQIVIEKEQLSEASTA